MSEPLSGKVVVLLSLLIGLVCGLFFFNQVPVARSTIEEPAIDMFGAATGTRVQIFPPASGMRGMSQVQAMQNTLQKYGYGSSPMQKLALTQLAATRDPSMGAQVREAFSEMDTESQNKMRKVSKEVIVRASNFETLKKEDLPGIIAPTGFFDPLGLADEGKGRKDKLYFYREAELKNGRVAMLATLSLLVTDKGGFHPFYEGAVPYASPVASHFTEAAATNFWPSLAVACGLAEMFSYPDGTKQPGDLGFDPLGLKPKTDEEFKTMQTKELNNGRLAMMAYAGIIGKELLTGVKF